MLEIVLPDERRVALVDQLTIGRACPSTVRLSDPSVSRVHARISAAAGGGAVLEDAGSSYGTWLDGRRVRAPTPLHAGSRIRVGDQELMVDRRPDDDQAGHTILVPQADTTVLTRFGSQPRVRSGYALKRLELGEGERRWVLKDLRSGSFVRLSDSDAELFTLIDGTRPLGDLVREAEQRLGPSGPEQLALLLASLGQRGLLSGSQGEADDEPRGWRRLAAARQVRWTGAADLFDRVLRGGGWVLLTRPALIALGALAAAGLAAFAYLVAARYGTPFVVARKVGIGAFVFIAGRLSVAAIHETAHGLVMASFGRRVREAGVKLVLIFPYVYVDTSDAWFEPRRRRIAVSAAGPASDLCLGGLFSLCCLFAGPGALRDIFFQLAFGAYVGAFFNLNPCIERDGYHILVDVLREPGLRRRASEQLRRRLAGGARPSDSPVLTRYSLLGLAWSLFGAGVAIVMSLRYEAAFVGLAPAAVVWTGIVLVWVALLLPVAALVALPLLQRFRARAG